MNRIVLGLLLASIPALSAGQSDARVVKPEIRVGDSWTYRSTNFVAPGTHEHESRVSFVNDKLILMVSTNTKDGTEVDSSWTPEWNAVTSHSGFMFRPHSGAFRFPLRIGDQHEVKYDLLRPRESAAMSSTTGTATVVGWETVEVPAGKFRAVRVKLESVVQPSDRSRAYQRNGSFWYVPEVRRWVKLEVITPRQMVSEELLSYKLNED